MIQSNYKEEIISKLISSRVGSYFFAAIFILLPIFPAAFAGLVGTIGLWRWYKRDFSRILWLLLVFALLGSLSQLLAPSIDQLYPSLPTPSFTKALEVGHNQIPPFGLDDLRGWNSTDTDIHAALKLSDGFYRFPRANPTSGREFVEFYSKREYPLQAGVTYTESFYLRHDGILRDPTITFYTLLGHHLIPTHIQDLGNGFKRVWASYTAHNTDERVRAIDFVHSGGTWTYLEVGFAQLEIGTEPTAYKLASIGGRSLSERFFWWWGTALLGWLVFLGSRWLLIQVKTNKVGLALLIGLGIHVGLALKQYIESDASRISGLTVQPNFLGHLVVVVGALVWLLSPRGLGLLGLILGLIGIIITGSRAAWLGWFPLLVAWVWGLGRWRWVISSGLLLPAIWFYLHPEGLGRFSTIFNPNDPLSASRVQFWSVAQEAFRSFPLSGIGWGNFSLFYDIHLPLNAIEMHGGHAHNIFLQLLAESGLLGLIAFLVLWGGIALYWLQSRAWPALLILAVVTGMNCFDFLWFSAGVHYGLWVIASLVSRDNLQRQGIN